MNEVRKHFKLTNLDLPYKTLKEFRDRKDPKNLKDYGEIAIKEGFGMAQKMRLRDYEITHASY